MLLFPVIMKRQLCLQFLILSLMSEQAIPCIRTIRVKGSHRTSVNRNLTSNPKTKVVPPRKSRRAGQ